MKVMSILLALFFMQSQVYASSSINLDVLAGKYRHQLGLWQDSLLTVTVPRPGGQVISITLETYQGKFAWQKKQRLMRCSGQDYTRCEVIDPHSGAMLYTKSKCPEGQIHALVFVGDSANAYLCGRSSGYVFEKESSSGWLW